jgi:acyl dehydratase
VNSTRDIVAAARWFEDYRAGSVHEIGSVRVDKDEVIEFARRYDPQVFHVDECAAKNTFFGGLIASGWHTAALMMRLLADNFISKVASLGAPAVDELRWHLPVRPGDVLSVRAFVLDTRRSRSKPDRGVMRTRVEVTNQRGELAMSLTAVNILLCRGPARDRH